MGGLVTGTTTALSVLGADSLEGEGNLTYTWAATAVPSGVGVPNFSINGSNAAKNTTVTFTAPGNYTFQVTITNLVGLTATSSVNVTVNQTLTSIGGLTPGQATLSTQSQDQFTVTGLDQFGGAMAAPGVTWTAAHGTITSSGLYTPPAVAGSDTITAQLGSFQATASVTIVAPVGWWKFNEGTGTTAYDSSANGDNGTITNCTWLAPPNGGNGTSALGFNGSSSVVSLGNPTELQNFATDQITFAAWIKPASITTNQYIIAYKVNPNNYVYLMITSSGTYQVGFDGSGTFHDASVAIPSQDLNSWVHLAGTFDGQTWRLYRDGQLVASSADSTTLINLSSTYGWGIGATTYPLSAADYFDGAIDDVRIYSTAISSSAIPGLEAVPPTVATPAAAAPSPVTGTTAILSVLGADDAGQSTLTYTWATTGTPPAPVSFSANGSNAAQNTTATFTAAGTYNFLVTMTNIAGLTATSSVSVTVSQTVTSITLSPATANLGSGQTQLFVATAYDQFGAALASPPAFTWSVLSGAGSINASGLYTAPYASGSATVQAQSASGGINSNVAMVTITDAAPTVADPAAAMPSTVTGTTTSLSVLGADADGGGEADLTYAWAATVLPTGASPPTFSVNGTHAAQNATATFTQAGSYQFTVTITDLGGLSTTSSVSVTVNQTLTTISLAGQPPVATAFDQFGVPLADQPEFDSGTDTITSSLVLADNVTVLPVAGSPLTITGGISGAGGLTVDNAGTLVLAGANSYTGGTVVSAGKLIVSNSSALADDTCLTIGTGAALFTGNQILTNIIATGQPPGTLYPWSATAFDQFGNPLANQPAFNAATDTITGPLVLVNHVTVLPVAGSPLTISGRISGAGGLTISGVPGTPGQGTVVLAGTNSYTGGTIVSAGKLIVSNASGIAANTSLTIGAIAVNLFKASLPSQSVPAAAVDAGYQVPRAGTMYSWSADQFFASRGTQFPGWAERIAGDPAWLWQDANRADDSDQQPKKNAAVLALDAWFAQYDQ